MKPETKLIAGVKHYRLKCMWCDGWCWTQQRKPGVYVCRTCTEPKFRGTLAQCRAASPISSESRYNG